MPDKITLMAPDGSIHYFDTWDELTDALKRAIANKELPSGMRYEAVVPTNHSAGVASMPTSQEQEFFSELAASHSGPAIPEAKRVYFQTRLRNRLFDYILGLFVREQKNGLTKAVLARRIGKPPEMINRWLGMPSNLTLDTVSDLLLGICAEELTPKSEPILDRSPQMQITLIEDGPKTNPSPPPIDVGRHSSQKDLESQLKEFGYT